MSPASRIPDAELWLQRAAADLRAAAALTDPDDRDAALGRFVMHHSWALEAIEVEREECRWAMDNERTAPAVPALRVVGGRG